jgi:hypothetical protein
MISKLELQNGLVIQSAVNYFNFMAGESLYIM